MIGINDLKVGKFYSLADFTETSVAKGRDPKGSKLWELDSSVTKNHGLDPTYISCDYVVGDYYQCGGVIANLDEKAILLSGHFLDKSS